MNAPTGPWWDYAQDYVNVFLTGDEFLTVFPQTVKQYYVNKQSFIQTWGGARYQFPEDFGKSSP